MDKGSLDKDKEAELRRKVFVGGISKNTTEAQLEDYFSEFGEIEDILVNRSAKKGVCKGCAFILFKSEKVSQKLINAPEKHLINEKLVECKEVHKKGTKRKFQQKQQQQKLQKNPTTTTEQIPLSKVSIISVKQSELVVPPLRRLGSNKVSGKGASSPREFICFKSDKSEKKIFLSKVLKLSSKIASAHKKFKGNLRIQKPRSAFQAYPCLSRPRWASHQRRYPTHSAYFAQ